jgi:hypothetical protein
MGINIDKISEPYAWIRGKDVVGVADIDTALELARKLGGRAVRIATLQAGVSKPNSYSGRQTVDYAAMRDRHSKQALRTNVKRTRGKSYAKRTAKLNQAPGACYCPIL